MCPDSISCDVLVVGGGAAGVAAAAAAGRVGARVVLLERYGFLGGLATTAEVGTICGLYLRDTVKPHPVPVAGGFGAEFGSRLQRATGVSPLRLEPGLWVLPFPAQAFARLADEIIKESGNVTLLLHATVADAQAEGPRLVQVRALAWNQALILRPSSLVDCTGEATAAALAGASIEDGATDQAAALVFALEGVEPDFVPQGLLEVRGRIRQAVQAGHLPAACERLALIPGAGADGHLSLKLNLTVIGSDRPLWQQVTAWEREGRDLVEKLQRFLIENTAPCKNARLVSVAPQIGIRSGHRIRGRTTLSDQEVLGAAKSPLGVARGAWPMERWGRDRRPELAFFNENDYYEVPLDCLRPVELDNVLAAGRCIAAAPKAMTSARVIGTALATGWAAGTAAAFQASGRPVQEAVGVVRKEMN